MLARQRLELVPQAGGQTLAALLAAHADQVHVAHGARHEAEQVTNQLPVVVQRDRRVGELVHQHRVVGGAQVALAPELLVLLEDRRVVRRCRAADVHSGFRSSATTLPDSPAMAPGGHGPIQLSRAPSTVITEPEVKSPAGDAR